MIRYQPVSFDVRWLTFMIVIFWFFVVAKNLQFAAINVSVCLSVCQNHCSNFMKFSINVTCGRGLILL